MYLKKGKLRGDVILLFSLAVLCHAPFLAVRPVLVSESPSPLRGVFRPRGNLCLDSKTAFVNIIWGLNG